MIEQGLQQLSREELVSLLLSQAALIATLQKEVEVLKMKLAKRQKPPTNSQNSYQPPSRDQKSGKMVNHPKRKHGPAEGHEKHERQFVANPDRVVDLRAKGCSACETDL